MRKVLAFVAALFISAGLYGQILKPVKWSFQSKKTAPNEYELIAKATIDKGWHLYSGKIKMGPDDMGPVLTTFQFKKTKGVELVGDIIERGDAHKVYEDAFEMDVIYFLDEASFVQKIKLTGPASKISGSLEFMVCDDHQCLPPDQVDFTHKVEYEKPSDDKGHGAIPRADDNIKSVKKESGNPENDNSGSNEDQPPGGFSFSGASENTGRGILNPVKWDYQVNSIGDNKYELVFTAQIEKGWHIYGLTTPKDGPSATSFTFDETKGLSLEGDIQSVSKPELVNDPVYEAEIAQYEGKAVFKQVIELTKPLEKVEGKLKFSVCDDSKCLPEDEVEFAFELPVEEISTADEPLWAIFFKGFLGGLLALLTPCVFPMIPLTVSFFLKGGKKKAQAIMSALLFGFSIIFIYVGLGLLISILFGADALNSMASNVYFNLIFFVVFMIFAFSFLGAFEITLPSSWTNKADRQSEKGGLIGIFFIAFTLALVSFSCTGPIIGSLLVIAAESGGYAGPVSGMGGFAVALALPFTLFAIFPTWMQNLPKSGGWLNSVKVTLGFVELALALKFLSAVDLAYHWDFLKREYFLALWVIIFALLGLYLLGKLRFSHDTKLEYISVPRLLFAIVSFAFAAYMVPGLWGAPVKLLSGLAPPLQYNEGFLPGNAIAESSGTTQESQEAKKYGNLFHSPHGIHAYYDYNEGLAAAKKAGKPLMIDFTGHSCVNCRKMEENVWSDPQVLERLKNDYILVSLYVDDKTDLADSEVYVSKETGKTINTLGRKWSDLQIKTYQQNAQPYYVLLDHQQKPLVEPRGYNPPTVSSYIDFLDEGVKEFHARRNLAGMN